ncbi:hypothetical protein FOZ60_002943 [Perkinsus olseni]|uniref:Uncharacterized protein n=1 Tax=Perkinsus olseni TaxID=32597 RepID=A0A7J6NXR1_PEROL|nr:hypothetical protein FOZ60_002943 [Perkinsus olseni]
MTTPSHLIFGLIFCILSFYCGAQKCLAGTYLIYNEEARPDTPIETIDPPVKVMDFSVTEDGECSVAFILNNGGLASGVFSALYTMDGSAFLKLSTVGRVPSPFKDDIGRATDITLSVLEPGTITMLWARGSAEYVRAFLH